MTMPTLVAGKHPDSQVEVVVVAEVDEADEEEAVSFWTIDLSPDS